MPASTVSAAGEIRPIPGRAGRVSSRDAGDGCLKMIEAGFLPWALNFGAEAGKFFGCLVMMNAAAVFFTEDGEID